MSNFMEKPACQNVDVHFYQTRNPTEWKARIVCYPLTHEFGPATIGTLLNNVANFVRNEAAYADLKVHGSVALLAAASKTEAQKEAQTLRRSRAQKALQEREEAAKDPDTVKAVQEALKEWGMEESNEPDKSDTK